MAFGKWSYGSEKVETKRGIINESIFAVTASDPHSLYFCLNPRTQIFVTYEGETINIDAKELFEALKK